jgi:hypothetical protein
MIQAIKDTDWIDLNEFLKLEPPFVVNKELLI